MAVGALGGPAVAAIGAICGAILAALAGGATGCAVGTRLGQAIDDHLLDAFACMSCGHRFKQSAIQPCPQPDPHPSSHLCPDDDAYDD